MNYFFGSYEVELPTNKQEDFMSKPTFAVPLAAFALVATVRADSGVDWSQYARSYKIVFSGYAGRETLTNFPALVRLSASRGFDYAECASDGDDLRFSDAAGNPIPHEIDTWDPDGESLVWVKVPSLTATTVITAHCGCENPVEVVSSDVWANGYVGVWHLGKTNSLTQVDSTSNRINFVCENFDTGRVDLSARGFIGGAVGFNKGDDNKGALTAQDPSNALTGFTDATFEMWLRPTNVYASANGAILSKRDNSKASYYLYQEKATGAARMLFSTTGATVYHGTATTAIPLDNWTHLAVIRTGATGGYVQYYNGENPWTHNPAANTPVGALYADPESPINLVLGNDKNRSSSTAFPGVIDELRISSVARSVDWVKATHDCMADADFATFDFGNDWDKYARKFTVRFPGAPQGTLDNFPVLVKVSPETIQGFSYADCRKDDGGDLRFSDENGNLLASEVDTWNTNGTSLVWVAVPSLTPSTFIKGYYGWNLAPAVDSAGVWTNGFAGVWHMNESAAPMRDATGGGASLSPSHPTDANGTGVEPGQSGIVGAAVEFGTRADNKGALRLDSATSSPPMLAGASAFTVELWTWQNDHEPNAPTRKATLLKETTSNGSASADVIEFYEPKSGNNSDGKQVLYYCATNAAALSNRYLVPDDDKPRPPRATWNYRVATFDSGTGRNILNCQTVKNHASSGTIRPSLGASTLYVGNSAATSVQSYPGLFDELRISSVARSDAWLQATYDTIMDNAHFSTYSNATENRAGTVLLFR